MKIEEAQRAPEKTSARGPNITALSAARAIWDWLWHFFSNVKVALILILVVTGLTLVGTLLVQVPADVAVDPGQHAAWLANVRTKFGVWTTFLDRTQMFGVFRSIWFKVSLDLLIVSIAVCSLNRWKGIWRLMSKPRLKFPESYYSRGANMATVQFETKDAHVAAEAFRKAAKKQGYGVLEQSEGQDSVYLYGDKNRFGQLGTYLMHLSIILLLIGVVVGGTLGFRNSAFMIPEGSTREVGYGTGLSVELVDFTDIYYVEGPPKDFFSDVIIYDKGVEVKKGTVRVNEPVGYKGIRLHQSFFGTAATMEVKDATGTVLFNDGVPLGWSTGKKPYERPLGVFSIPDQSLTAYVVGPVKSRSADPLIGSGQMRVEVYGPDGRAPLATGILTQGQPAALNGLTFTFQREGEFTGLQVVKDPGGNIVWLASTLMVVGLAGVFYFPHRRMWAYCRTTASGTCELSMRAMSRKDLMFHNEFKSLSKEIEKAANPAPGQKKSARADGRQAG